MACATCRLLRPWLPFVFLFTTLLTEMMSNAATIAMVIR